VLRSEPGDSIGDIESRGGHLRFDTHTAATRFAVVSEVWHPGWRALLDGRPVSLERTDEALLGLFVPAGDHRVEIEFRPTGWRAGLWVSGIAIAALAGAGLVSGRAGRGGRGRAPAGR